MAKGYSFAALVDVLYPVYKTSLGNGIDLNSFNSNDHVGVYVQTSNASAASGSNYPEPSAGCLEVLPNAGGVIQRYTAYAGDNNTYVRSIYDGTWSAWKRYLTNGTIYNTVYPIGICVQFDANVNPNTAFPGTTWAQIVDGRQVRAAENAAAIGTVGGSDTVVLDEENLPVHTHTMADHVHSSPIHSHTIAQHSHTLASHAHTMTHGHTATIAYGGTHTHPVAVEDGGGSPAPYNMVRKNRDDQLLVTDTALLGNSGDHRHSASVADFTGSTAASGELTVSTGGPTATGNNTAANTGSAGSGNTGNWGSASPSAISTAGAWHKYSIWKRTA